MYSMNPCFRLGHPVLLVGGGWICQLEKTCLQTRPKAGGRLFTRDSDTVCCCIALLWVPAALQARMLACQPGSSWLAPITAVCAFLTSAQATPAAAAAAAAGGVPAGLQSPLLCCLSQLNDDMIAAHLLPKLVEHGSASAVFRTCSQLRRLIQPIVQHLDLTKQLQETYNPCHSPKLAKQLIAHFPNCTVLKCAWISGSSSVKDLHRSMSLLLKG